MKQLLSVAFFLTAALSLSAQTSKYGGMAGQNAAFNARYKLSVTLDEQKNKLSFETDAPLQKVTFTTYTVQELSVRNGKEYVKNFSSPGHSLSYDLNQAIYKNKQAYWLKFYTTDSLFEEYYFQKRTVAPAPVNEEPPVDSDEEIRNADGATVVKTNITCAAGKSKVMAALKELEGVTDVQIDIKNGQLVITYSSDGTPYTEIINTINQNGFSANGKVSNNKAANTCTKKTAN